MKRKINEKRILERLRENKRKEKRKERIEKIREKELERQELLFEKDICPFCGGESKALFFHMPSLLKYKCKECGFIGKYKWHCWV